VAPLPLTWISNLLRFKDPVSTSSQILHQELANQQIATFYQAMFPALMPRPMTFDPTNEAVRHENHAKKTFDKEKINRHDPGGHERCKDSITIKEV
jgi:hypothetical protein